MNKTSLGFHTVTIVKKLTREEAKQLYRDFKNYKDRTGEIDFFPLRKNIKSDTIDEFIKWLYSGSSRYIIVHYPFRNIGIHWVLRYGNKSPGFIIPEDADRPCSIKATINPKILSGEKDYLAAATSINLKEAEALFNIEARKISPILGVYGQYLFNRQDYCINFDLQELGIQCTPEQMIYLIRQGDIPRHYSERTEYNKASKRQVPDKNSFYLESKSATINCYHKQMQLQKEFPNCPDLHGSRNIIRFEVQCKYLKVYNLSKDMKNKPGISYSEIIREMLSEDFCGELIEDYFNRVVWKGDYFTLDGARWMVEAQNFRREKEERLIYALELINDCRGIAKAKSKVLGIDKKDFKRSLKDLDEILVNPVTIPRGWGIKYIPNPLKAYYDSFYEEQVMTSRELLAEKYLAEYLGQ